MRINPALPDDLGRIINKALEKDRNLRYQSASDLRADLQRLKRDSDSGTRSAASAEAGRATPMSRSRRSPVIFVVAGMLAVALAVAGYLLWPRLSPVAGCTERENHAGGAAV